MIQSLTREASGPLRCLQGGYQVFLDHRVLRTPARQPVVLPTLALATAVAAEWEMQARAGVCWGLRGSSL